MMKNAFYFRFFMLFIYKLFLLSRYLNFCFDFLVIQKKQLDQKYKVNFKIYNVATDKQTVGIQIFSNISRNKINQIMRFGQLIVYNKRTVFFFKNHPENEARRLVPNFSLLFKKALYKLKASDLQLSFNTFCQPSTQHTIKTNSITLQAFDSEISSILIFQKSVC